MSRSSRRKRRRARWLRKHRKANFKAHKSTWPQAYWTAKSVEAFRLARNQIAIELAWLDEDD